ncbi:MAG TPA: hypothetical protein V6D17_20420 [Candidatus Obscuribacterales bacterium]
MSDEGKHGAGRTGDSESSPDRLGLKEKILKGLDKSFTGEETRRWLSVLEDNKGVEETIAPGQHAGSLDLTMPALVDQLFDNLQRYTFEFNKTGIADELKVHCERPKGLHEYSDFTRYRGKVLLTQGHISTRAWALVIQGVDGEVFVFVIPADFIIGFRPGQTEFHPYLTITRSEDQRGASWSIEERALANDSVPKLARRLFGHLIRVVKGEASEGEKFSFASRPAPPGMGGLDRSYDRSEDDPGLWLLRPEDFETPAPSTAKKAEAAAPAPSKGDKARKTSTKLTPTKKISAKVPETVTEAFDQNNNEVRDICVQLVNDIDRLLDKLQQIGMKAMKEDSMADVARAMKRSQALKTLKEKAISFAEEWDHLLTENK